MTTEQSTATKSPDEWGAQLYPTAGMTRWRHELAAIGHGWAAHAHATAKPMKLTRADYQAAVNAAVSGVVFAPALSPHAPSAKAARKAAAAAPAAPAAPTSSDSAPAQEGGNK